MPNLDFKGLVSRIPEPIHMLVLQLDIIQLVTMGVNARFRWCRDVVKERFHFQGVELSNEK